ncbi:MFS transporter, TsgA protein [Colwellia chukchiensis]|uniref:MFS transporter, TsgA protein n=1 Tax=Colwellia chukchiensis TaxID=641665 RepID=A0A1H7M3T8_9GAMM|nr:MFS transporter TsgA [Colwellia chukchiensis]SEL05772.1 MFS transporter, TsgA protein [Colwellia chukchiensis]
MSVNKISLTVISLLISFTLSGFGTQIGLLIKPMSEQFGVALTSASSQFSWYLGGILVGNILSLAIFRYFKVKLVVISCYLMVFLLALWMHFVPDFTTLPLLLSIMGVACGLGVCASSTILTEIWSAKKRGSLLVSQDALYNSAGMIFPFITAYLLANNFSWSIGYLVVASATLLIVILALFTRFDFDTNTQATEDKNTEWHIGLTVAGISLFFAIICSLTPIIWLPNYLVEKFAISENMAAEIIPKVFLAALIGSILSAFIVAKIKVQTFLIFVVMLGCGSLLTFTAIESLASISYIAYAFGLAIAALYHSFMAWGLSYIKKPNYRHVTFMYLCGGIGGTLAPYMSSLLVEKNSITAVFIGCAILYGIILFMILALKFKQRNNGVIENAIA